MPIPAIANTAVSASSFKFPLDKISSTPTTALALRKLRAAYAGNSCTIRRSSDNTTQAIGFSGKNWDSAGAISFTGANNGFISTLNDQSGNTRDFTQATNANQPQVINAGAAYTSSIGTVPTIRFDGAAFKISNSSTLGTFITASAWTFFAVAYASTSTSNSADPSIDPCLFADNAGYICGSAFGSTGPQVRAAIYDGAQKNTSNAYTYSTAVILLAKYDGTNLKSYIGGGAGNSIASGNVQVTTGTPIQIGAGRNNVNFLNGYLSEVMMFNVALSVSDCNTLANDMAAYYGLSWSNIS